MCQLDVLSDFLKISLNFPSRFVMIFFILLAILELVSRKSMATDLIVA